VIIAITGSRTGVPTTAVHLGLKRHVLRMTKQLCLRCHKPTTPQRLSMMCPACPSGEHWECVPDEATGLVHPADLQFRVGDAAGVDMDARDYLDGNGYILTVYCASDKNFRQLSRLGFNCVAASDWGREGRSAGAIRNSSMLAGPPPTEQLVSFWDGRSPGTRSCVGLAGHRRIPIVDGLALSREVWK
jgi:hypothetical protein